MDEVQTNEVNNAGQLQQQQQQQNDNSGQNTSVSPQKDIQQHSIQQQSPDLIGLFLQQKRKKLGYCQVDIFDNKPQETKTETMTIEFGIQCDLEEQTQQKQQQDEEIIFVEKQQRRESRNRQSILQSAEKQVQQVEHKITIEEINSIVQSQTFGRFFEQSTKMVEKAILRPEVDILEDFMYSETIVQEIGKDLITHQISFFDPTYSDNRVVTAVEWSPNLPNTLLTAYSQNEEASITDQVGVALLWSLQLKSRPEFYCFANSPIISACFHPFSPSLVIGGLYNGQIVIWDLRAKHTPEKRTTLNSGGHSQPIFSLNVVGSQNAHNLVSTSNDGKVCVWNLAMLNQPQKMIDLKVKQKTQGNQVEINATCMKFQQGDANNFYVGAEDGCLYKSKLHQNQNENVIVPFEEHSAAVTGISLNSSASPTLQNLILSSSFDWTVKLWNSRSQVVDKCVQTFECSEDYVYDVKWNGVHPTLFSSVDGEGYVDLWDISTDMEAPINRFKSGNNSLNKCQWSKDGTKLAIGDAYGTVQVLSLQQKALKQDNEKISRFETWLKTDK